MKQIKTWTTLLLLAGAMMKLPPGFAQKMVSDSVTASSQLPNARPMIAVIFEVVVAEGHQQEYLDIAKRLLPQLKEVDGFISIERFESLHTPGKILSLSFWRDEESVKHWRNTEEHRWAQEKGRQGVFRDYRLRVVGVIRDYGMFDRDQAPDDSKVRHDNLKN
jgi:heme-degrading monooxygenase HmoA